MGEMASGSNWLGFSLSSHMNIEAPSSEPAPAHHTSAPSSATMFTSPNNATTCNFLFSPSAQMAAPSPGYYYVGGAYGDGTTTAGVYYSHPHLPVMPVKSDGSLCDMEGMMASSSPKLEDFLGGGNGGGHDTATYYNDGQEENDGSKGYQYNQIVPYNYQPLTEAEMLQEAGAPMEEAMAAAKNFLVTNYGACYSNGEMQPLSLSMMSPGSQSSGCVSAAPQQQHQMASVAAAAADQGRSNGGGEQCVGKKRGTGKGGHKQPVYRKSIDTFGQRTSQYRGVTRHRWTGRYEAHLWDNSCKRDGQTRKGRQVYLGGYDTEEKAARAYDLAALKYWGPATCINFPLEHYRDELEEMKDMTRLEYVAHLRRRSSGFSRGASIYRGVTRHHQHGRWQARIGRVAGNKDLYLGTYSTQEEAAEAYDVAAIKFRGLNAVTNFDITRYDVEKIMESNVLLPGEEARKVKAIGAANGAFSVMTMQNSGRELNDPGTEWRMVLHDQEAVPCAEAQDDPHKGSLHGIAGLDVECEAQRDLHDVSGRSSGGGVNLSNSSSSSLVTNSREGSSCPCPCPADKLGLAMLYNKHANAAVSLGTMSPWMQMPATAASPHMLRPPNVSHLPVFAAWADA